MIWRIESHFESDFLAHIGIRKQLLASLYP